MPQTLAQSFYLGPFAVYTSPTGMVDAITGIPYLGGTLHEGDYVDLLLSEAAQWNIRFGVSLNTGRYRFVRLSTAAVAANLAFGKPVGWGNPTSVGQVAIAVAGTGYTNGTYTLFSTAAGGTAATILVTVTCGIISSVQLASPGANMTSVPTFTLTALGAGSGGSILAQMAVDPNFVSTFDASSISLANPRGIALTTVTAAQVTAGAWIVIQESGIAPVLVTTATATAAGSLVSAITAGAVNAVVSTTPPANGVLGYTLDLAAANTIVRVDLDLPIRQG